VTVEHLGFGKYRFPDGEIVKGKPAMLDRLAQLRREK
jgi:hypothetical protein